MNQLSTLDSIRPGERAVVRRLTVGGSMRRRFLDIGLVENTTVECLGRSPGGDPSAYLIRGAVVALRRRDAAGVALAPGGREGRDLRWE